MFVIVVFVCLGLMSALQWRRRRIVSAGPGVAVRGPRDTEADRLPTAVAAPRTYLRRRLSYCDPASPLNSQNGFPAAAPSHHFRSCVGSLHTQR